MKQPNKNGRCQQDGGRRSIGLRTKLFFCFLGFSLFAVAVLWVFQMLFFDKFYYALTKKRMESVSSFIARSTAYADFDQEMESLARRNAFCIRVYTVEGNAAKTLASVDSEIGCVIHLLSNRQLNELFDDTLKDGGRRVAEYRLMEEDFRFALELDEAAPPPGAQLVDERLVYASLETSPSGERLFVLLDCALTPIDATVIVLREQLSVITLLLVAVSLLLAFFLARNISDPLATLNRAAKGLSNGTYPENYHEDRYREVEELSETLSTAACELSKVDRLQKELIANISHDLRTPLTMIIGYAEVMRDIEGENTPENVQVIIDEATRLSSMVQDLVEISRYQNTKARINPAFFSLTASLSSLAEEYAALCAPKGYTVLSEVAEELFVLADQKRILQVMRNLIDNAVNYSGEDKTVILRLIKKDRVGRVEIEDHGGGIAEEDLPYIWDRYYKVEKPHIRGVVGSGLGLSIVRANLELHAAVYGVESELSRGSVFWFELPLVDPPALEAAPGEPEEAE